MDQIVGRNGTRFGYITRFVLYHDITFWTWKQICNRLIYRYYDHDCIAHCDNYGNCDE